MKVKEVIESSEPVDQEILHELKNKSSFKESSKYNNIGKDGNLYVDYGCDQNYDKFVEVDPTCFNIARAEAVKEDVR